MKRMANAVWNGGLKDGRGTFSVASGTIRDQKVTFRTRFEDEPNQPEELIAAAPRAASAWRSPPSSASAASRRPRSRRPVPSRSRTSPSRESLLRTTVRAPGADEAKIEEAAAAAKAGCPISKVLKLEIGLELSVEG